MSSNLLKKRTQTGFAMSIIILVAGVTGLVYQFMPDGTFLTFLVCFSAVMGLVNNSRGLDERENQLLMQSYGSAFIYLFAAVIVVYLFTVFAGLLNLAGPLIAAINSHWIGILVSAMCIFLGIVGIRNFREIK